MKSVYPVVNKKFIPNENPTKQFASPPKRLFNNPSQKRIMSKKEKELYDMSENESGSDNEKESGSEIEDNEIEDKEYEDSYKIRISREPNAPTVRVPKTWLANAIVDSPKNTFEEFINSRFVDKDSSFKSQVKLSTLIEYYKFWCLFNDKTAMDCYHHVIIPLLYKNGYRTKTLKRGNKRTKFVCGLYLTKTK